MSHSRTKGRHSSARRDFDDFVNGYITAALWSSTDWSDESGGEPLDKNYSEDDIAPSSFKAMKRDCARFFKQNRKALEEYASAIEYVRHRGEGTAWHYAGHDFWLTANGHGAGFWDREGIDKDLGQRLSKASKKFASDLEVGDDGKIYVSPER